MPPLTRSQSRLAGVLLLLNIAVRFTLAPTAGYEGDLIMYQHWGDVATQVGVGRIYDPASYTEHPRWVCDYPPVLPYLFGAISAFYQSVTGRPTLLQTPTVTWPVKLLPILADLCIVFLIFFRLRRSASFNVALVASASFAFNPAVLFNSAYWGQTDSVVFFLVLLAMVFLSDRKPEWCAVTLTLAAFTKPFGYVLGPLAVIMILRNHGLKRLGTAALASLGTILLLFAPFILAGNFVATAKTMVTQMVGMPNVSNNAHNLWGIVSFWRALDAGTPFLGPLDYRHLGIMTFIAVYAVAFRRIKEVDSERALALLCGVGFAVFFMVMVHQHENHLFGVLPFLALVWPFERRVKWVFAAITITFSINMLMHDPALMAAVLDADVERALEFYHVPPLQAGSLSGPIILWMLVVAANIVTNVAIVGYAIRLVANRVLWVRLLGPPQNAIDET